MTTPFLRQIRLDGFLSFAPGSEPIELRPLNVLIGPNGSGKSNLIEAIELLRAIPTAFASAIRHGGGVHDWIWKGDSPTNASIAASLDRGNGRSALRYRLEFGASNDRAAILDESIEDDGRSYYRYDDGTPVLSARRSADEWSDHRLSDLSAFESVLSQRKDPIGHPELTWCAAELGKVQTFREWSFGRTADLRRAQRVDLPTDFLLPDASNLPLILNELAQTKRIEEIDALLRRFLPRFHRLTTLTRGGMIQLLLHEQGLSSPLTAARLSDGTLRFIALLAALFVEPAPRLLCIEEPELGLHPDALPIVAEALVEASARTQIIVTTHSEVLLSYFTEHIESVLVCEHLGGTQLHRLSADMLSHWLDRYRLGDLWLMGELGGTL